jgi:uncharacterized ferritin-like protein (DUF455 family)
MAIKSAKEKLGELRTFIPNVKKAIKQFEELKRRLETEEGFRKLWETNSAEALRQVGINPNARMEVGLDKYSKGPRCDWCITPQGNA